MLAESFVAGFKFMAWLISWSCGAFTAGIMAVLIASLSLGLFGLVGLAIISFVNPAEAAKIREKMNTRKGEGNEKDKN